MATLIEKNLPYKLYSAINLGSKEGMFYLGKVPNNLNFNKKVYSDDYYNNCSSGYYFSIASLVPGSCVRMDPADEADSSILIDAKWVDFRPCNATTCDVSAWPKTSILSSVDYKDPMIVKPQFKSLSTDGTIVISGVEPIDAPSFIWNDEGINDPSLTDHCTLMLQAWKYKFRNKCEPGPYFGTIGTPGESDVIFLMRSLMSGSQCVGVADYGSSISVYSTCNPCCDNGPPVDPVISTDCVLTPCPNLAAPSSNIICNPYIPSNIGEFI